MSVVTFGSPPFLAINPEQVASVSKSEFRDGVVIVRMIDGAEHALGNTSVAKVADSLREADYESSG